MRHFPWKVWRAGLRRLAAQQIVAALILSVSCSAAAGDRGDAFSFHLTKGIEEGRQGNFSPAMADLEAAVKLNPASPDAWYQMGLLLGQLADFRSAESAFRRAISLKPDFAQAHYSLGLTLTANPRSKLDWPGAIREFREAVKYKPDYAEAMNLLGAGLTKTGDVGAAIPELRHALQLKPTLSAAHFNLAIALEQDGKLKEAEQEYRFAVSTKGGYPEASTALGKLLLRVGKPVDAENELRGALRLNPDLPDAHYALARVLQSLKKNAEAAVEFDQFKDLSQREQDATQASLLSNSGLGLAAKGDSQGAINALRKAAELKPDYGVPHYNLGLVLADKGDFTAAEQELTKAVSLLPGQSKPWFDLGRVRSRMGDKKGAVEAISIAARLAPEDSAIAAELVSLRGNDAAFSTRDPKAGASSESASGHIGFANELIARGDHLGAVGELLRALALDPVSLDARSKLASSYEQIHDYPRSILEFYKILCISPDDMKTRLDLGTVLLERGELETAADQFRAVLVRHPDSVLAKTSLERATHATNAK